MPNLFIIVALGMLISGCISTSSPPPWPADLPEKSYFIKTYKDQTRPDANSTDIKNHLIWIKRFYQGTIFYPTGWNQMTSQVIDSLDLVEHKERMARRLFKLGKIISVEWAKPNNARKIDSATVGVWGNSLRTAAERSDQFAFISRVEQDVKDLLNGSIKSSEISNERYYPGNEHDNF